MSDSNVSVGRSRKRLLEDFTLWEMMSLTAARFSVNICIRVSDCTAQVEFCWRLDTCTDTRGGQCSVAPFLPRTLLETAERFVNVCVRACVCVCVSAPDRGGGERNEGDAYLMNENNDA